MDTIQKIAAAAKMAKSAYDTVRAFTNNSPTRASLRTVRAYAQTVRRAAPSGTTMLEAKASKKRGGSTMVRGGGKIAVSSAPAPVTFGYTVASRAGLSDFDNIRMQYVAGYIYIGNGTLGAAAGVYFQPAGNTGFVAAASTGIAPVAIAPADTTFGVAYVTDIFKHFQRWVCHSVRLHFVPISTASSTSTGVDVVVGPIRGCAVDVILSSTTTAPNSVSSLIGATGARQFPVWQSHTVDLTPYIAGGSGSRQNEFNMGMQNIVSAETVGDLSQAIPCAFYIAGDAPASTYNGLQLMRVWVEMTVTLKDFIGGMNIVYPGANVGKLAMWKGRQDSRTLPSDRENLLAPVELKDFKSKTCSSVGKGEDAGRRVDGSKISDSDQLPLTRPLLIRQTGNTSIDEHYVEVPQTTPSNTPRLASALTSGGRPATR